MNSFLCLILAFTAAAPTDGVGHDALEVFHCDFERDEDANFDGWPDEWTRRRGRGFPQYLRIEIDKPETPCPSGEQCLKLELDGGAAIAFSPPIPVSPMLGYLLQGHLKTHDLEHDVAYVEVVFLDENQNSVETYRCPQLQTGGKWQAIHIGPMTPSDPSIRFALLALHLRPTDRADLFGYAQFDDLRLLQVPRINVETNSPHNVYVVGNEVHVTCRVSGVRQQNPVIHFELLDLNDQVLSSAQKQIVPREEKQTRNLAASVASLVEIPVEKPAASGFAGSANWKTTLDTPGFYRVRVVVQGDRGVGLERDISLAIVELFNNPDEGEFGWTLPNGDDPHSLNTMANLLSMVGVNWIKFPVWYDATDQVRADHLAWFFERLSNFDIRTVGVLDRPPGDLVKRLGNIKDPPVASIFADAGVWTPMVDPIMTRLSLKIRWWQLGRDDDVSFVGYPDLKKKIGEIKKHLERYGQEIKIGFPWHWISQPPQLNRTPWQFLSYTADPPLTDAELQTYLNATKATDPQRWVVLQPLVKNRYQRDVRIRDLVTRMVSAKISQANAIFVPCPFDENLGLMKEDGTPDELFLPWRTTAYQISGATYIGQIQMRSGSSNRVFLQRGKAVIVVWNEEPTNEVMYFGEHVKQVDVWGRTRAVDEIEEADVRKQVIPVGKLPTFLTGVSLPVVKWQIGFRFDKQQIASIFGSEQPLPYRFTNHFPQGVSGDFRVVAPKMWDLHTGKVPFQLAESEEKLDQMTVLLKAGADSGERRLRIDFRVAAEREYKFSIYRTIEVGLGDVTIEMMTRINEAGELVIEQTMTNKGRDRVSFNCMLFAPGRRRERQQVLKLGEGRSVTQFILPDGEELIGKLLWLRAEEIGGNRVMNHRIIAEH